MVQQSLKVLNLQPFADVVKVWQTSKKSPIQVVTKVDLILPFGVGFIFCAIILIGQ